MLKRNLPWKIMQIEDFMRIGLIEACDPDWGFKRFSYPLQLGYLASYIKKMEDDRKTAVFTKTDILIAEEIDEILKAKPDIVGISSYSINYNIAVEFARKIKDKLKIPVILGGCHISALPETLDPVFDVAVIGEGEQTFHSLVSLYHDKGRFEAPHLNNVRGIIYYDGKNIVRTEPRPFMKYLDSIPPPDRALYKIRSGNHYISTSRGCPFQCTFCSPRLIWKNTRFFSARHVVSEIMQIIRQFPDTFTHLSIVDDLFISNKKRLNEIRDMFVKTGLNRILTLQLNVRADLIDDEMAQILADINSKTVNFGAESGSDRILKYYDKKTTVEDNRRAIDILFNHGIKAIPSFIIGAPMETPGDFQATVDFIEENHEKLAGFEIFPLIPMPGSRMWDYAMEKGKVALNMDWARLEPVLLDFDPEKYIYLVEEVSNNAFYEWVKLFQELYARYNPQAMKFREMLEKMKQGKTGNG